jgi:hypothetical protein
VEQHNTVGGEPVIHLGEREDYVDLRVTGGTLLIELAGAPAGDKIYDGIRQGYIEGWIRNSMPTLVDVSAFNGPIDWAAIRKITQLADWGEEGGEPSRVAYFTRDPMFMLVAKAASALFPRSRHRVFGNRHAALTWLRAA